MRRSFLACLVTAVLAFPGHAAAQSTETLGTRAQGMGGAFVGMADDASAVYWNPGGLAGGAYFSLVVDGATAEAAPEGRLAAGNRNAWLLALSMPALGLSYYRLQSTTVRPTDTGARSRIQSLTTQHLGATFVHTIFGGIAAGTTLKLVRGVAAAAEVDRGTPEDLLDHADLIGHGSNQFDLDIGVMARGAAGAVGVVIRNVTEPGFRTADDTQLRLDMQARLGGSVLLLEKWKLAADIDLMTNRGVFADVRELAIGSEGQVTRQLTARGGVRFNTIGDAASPALSVGASYAVFGSVLVDAQITGGSDNAFRGWGLAGRFVF